MIFGNLTWAISRLAAASSRAPMAWPLIPQLVAAGPHFSIATARVLSGVTHHVTIAYPRCNDGLRVGQTAQFQLRSRATLTTPTAPSAHRTGRNSSFQSFSHFGASSSHLIGSTMLNLYLVSSV